MSERLFGVDLRGLAFLRIGLSVCVLYDLATRSADLHAHYTDFGILPRAVLLNVFGWLHEWTLCAHLISGSVEVQVALFVIHAAAALAMLLGYRTRLATFLTWWLTSSIQWRNPLIGAAYDALLRMLLLWAVFLPLGSYFSLDSVRHRSAAAARRVFSAGTVALLMQISIVLWAAGYAKWTAETWINGAAVQRILHDDLFATAFGQWVGGLPGVCLALTRAVPLIELAGPVLLLCSGWSALLRMFAIFVLCALNLGFALTIDAGLFPWLMSIAVFAFMPPSFWERASRWMLVRRLKKAAATNSAWQRLTHYVSRPAAATVIPPGVLGNMREGVLASRSALREGLLVSRSALREGLLVSRSALREGSCVLLIVAVVHWNIGVARDRSYIAPWYSAWLVTPLFLQQDWRMYADAVSITGWIVIPARLVGGREIDLLADGGRVPSLPGKAVAWEQPSAGLDHYANGRWRTLLRQVLAGENQPAARLFSAYLCREWNARHTGDDQLKTFQITYVVGALIEPYKFPDYAPEVIWTHDCFG